MNNKNFEGLMAGLNDALSYAKGQASLGACAHPVKVDRASVAAIRLKAGLTQQEFAKITGASLGMVRKWERGERNPSGAAGMLIRIFAIEPKLVIREAGIMPRTQRRQRRAKAA